MNRALAALFLTPMLVGIIFLGVWVIFATPFLEGVALILAFPLFWAFQIKGWLNWWHAFLAGACCGAAFAAFDTLMDILPFSMIKLDDFITWNNVWYTAFGALIGFVFWWLGIFRNAAFPYVSREWPLAAVIVLPLAAGLVPVHHALRLDFYEGRVIEILDRPDANSAKKGHATVRLSDGHLVQADFGNTWPISIVDGHCVELLERWSLTQATRIYEVNSAYGAWTNQC
jgi:hypothetical protein